MPFAHVNGTRLYYRAMGQGSQTVVFSHSYLLDSRHFDAQVAELAGDYRIVTYDHRGHGRSDKPWRGYSMESIYADGLGLLDTLGIDRCHWVGLSTGGFVGMRLGVRQPQRIRSLSLLSTSADREPRKARARYTAMFALVAAAGFGPVEATALAAIFGRSFLNDPSRRDELATWRARLTENSRHAIIAFGLGIFGRDSVLSELRQIECPTLVMVGGEDVATPPLRAEQIAGAIPGSQLVTVPRAGHLCTIEAPDQVTGHLREFLAGVDGA